MSARILQTVNEKAQYEVALDLDIPFHRQDSEAVANLLEAMAECIDRAIYSNKNLVLRTNALGIDIVGVRVDKC